MAEARALSKRRASIVRATTTPSRRRLRSLAALQALLVLVALSVPAQALAHISWVSLGTQSPDPVPAGGTATYIVDLTLSDAMGPATHPATITNVVGLPAGATWAADCVLGDTAGPVPITLTVNVPAGPLDSFYAIAVEVRTYYDPSLCVGTLEDRQEAPGMLHVQGTTSTVIAADAPDPSQLGSAYTVDVSVTRESGTAVITGSVTVSDGADSCTDTAPDGGLATTVTYACDLTSTTSGPKTLTATYSGDANLAGSISAGVPHTVSKLAQAALVVTGTTGGARYYDTRTLGTTGGSGGGGVSYHSGTPARCTVSGDVATMVASSGTCSVYAVKAADASFEETTSAPVDLDLGPAVLTVTPGTVAVTYGDSVPAYLFRVTGFRNHENATTAQGYADPSCTSDYAHGMAVSSSPRTITCVAGNATHYAFDTGATAVLTIARAAAACPIQGAALTYDGDPHGASGSCTGVRGETLAGLDLGAEFTDVPGGIATWAFADVTGNYNNDSGTVDIEITKERQEISFGVLATRKLGSAPFDLVATAGSGLPVAFASMTPASCTVSGVTVRLAAVGRCTIRATQPGDGNVEAAAPVVQSFDVLSSGVGPDTAASVGPSAGPAEPGAVPLPLRFGMFLAAAFAVVLVLFGLRARRSAPRVPGRRR
jgi:hypothetical protein